MKQMLQVTDTLPTREQALEVLDGLKIQDGYEFGRVLDSTRAKPGYRVQAFLRDDGSYIEGSLDGVRRVMVPEGMERLLAGVPVGGEYVGDWLRRPETGTGRLYRSEPELQNIPIPGAAPRERRPIPDHIVSVDFSEIELRVAAAMGDPTNESLLTKAQAGEWFSRHDLVLDPGITGQARQDALDERAEFLKRRAK